jgi:hypothetical protein
MRDAVSVTKLMPWMTASKMLRWVRRDDRCNAPHAKYISWYPGARYRMEPHARGRGGAGAISTPDSSSEAAGEDMGPITVSSRPTTYWYKSTSRGNEPAAPLTVGNTTPGCVDDDSAKLLLSNVSTSESALPSDENEF